MVEGAARVRPLAGARCKTAASGRCRTARLRRAVRLLAPLAVDNKPNPRKAVSGIPRVSLSATADRLTGAKRPSYRSRRLPSYSERKRALPLVGSARSALPTRGELEPPHPLLLRPLERMRRIRFDDRVAH